MSSDWIVSDLDHDLLSDPAVILQTYLHDNWNLAYPISVDNIKWGQWQNNFGDIHLICIENSTTPSPLNLGWSMFSYDALIDIHLFVRTTKPGYPIQLYNMRAYIEQLLSQNPRALSEDQGIDFMRIDNIAPGEAQQQATLRLTSYHLVISVLMRYNKSNLITS